MSNPLASRHTLRATAARAHIGYLHAFFRFMGDGKASLLGKFWVFAAVAYVVMPLDLVPDLVPIVGWLDDLGVVAITLGYLSRVLQPYRFPVVTAQGSVQGPVMTAEAFAQRSRALAQRSRGAVVAR